jgi:UDP-glucose 4-epimerase
LVADISLAGQLLKWKPKYDIEKMVSDTWESANAADSK